MRDKMTLRRHATGVPGLDSILGGGLPEFSFNLIAGPPGSGKTTLAHQIMFALATQERPALFFTVLGEPPLKMLRYQQQFSFFDADRINQTIRFVNLSDEVATGDFLTSPHEKSRYNAVIFCHTLEHFANPVASIARAYELLKPGGVLWLAVPNYGSWQARLFGRFWFHVDAPRHYFHFTVKSLDAILQRHHFRVVQLDHFNFEQNPYGLLQSSLNALGFRFNLLYSLLKNSTARTDTALHYPIQTAMHVLLVPFLFPLVLLATILETIFKSGGTFEMYAFKE